MSDFKLQPGDVVVHGLGPTSGWISRQIAKHTGSRWTHVALAICDHRLAEAWYPDTRIVPRAGRLAALEAARVEYRVLRPQVGLTYAQTLQLTAYAEQFGGTPYPWWQIALYALTGWFWTGARQQVICSRLVPAALHAAGIPVWDLSALRYVPTALQDQLFANWATPADLVRYGAFNIVAANPTYH